MPESQRVIYTANAPAFGAGWFALSPAGIRVSGTGSNGGASGY